jgi:hypothetical protein
MYSDDDSACLTKIISTLSKQDIGSFLVISPNDKISYSIFNLVSKELSIDKIKLSPTLYFIALTDSAKCCGLRPDHIIINQPKLMDKEILQITVKGYDYSHPNPIEYIKKCKQQ